MVIVGPSGCGKTTFIKCLAGMVAPSEGEIYFDGRLMTDLPPEERGVGYVFQEIALFPTMSVWDNVTYGPRVRGWSSERTRRTAREFLDMIKLEAREDSYPRELSGGARQKTGVARALASGSNLILFDEPLGALDAKVRVELRYEIRNLVRDLKLTAIHITHDQEEALSIADRVVVMKAGSFVEVGTPDELYEHPKTIFGANFVGEANFLEGTVLNADGETSTIEWGEGLLLESQNASPGEGERVVAAIRPESVIVQKGNDEEGIRGFVETMDFEGETARYEVKIPGYGLFAVRIPFHRGSRPYDVGDPVVIKAPPNKVLLYPYPKEGLQKELDIESRG